MEHTEIISTMLNEAWQSLVWQLQIKIQNEPDDLVLLLVATVAFAACACRLDALQYRVHKLRIIVLHGALAVACAASAYHAWDGRAGVLEWAAVVAALAWIATSFKTWGSGAVPRQFVTKPMELDGPALRHVNGGKRDGEAA